MFPHLPKPPEKPLSYAGVNSLGLRRRGFEGKTISEIQEVYRYLFLNSWNNSKALEEIEINLPATRERDEIVNFIRSSERGVMKGYIQWICWPLSLKGAGKRFQRDWIFKKTGPQTLKTV